MQFIIGLTGESRQVEGTRAISPAPETASLV